MLNSKYAPTLLRIGLGLLFLLPGLSKLANPAGIIGMLGGMGIPMATLMGWILILSEIGFGGALLVGYRVKKVVWPLLVIMVVALLAVHVPAWIAAAPMAMISVLTHVLAILGLTSIYLSGPGELAVKG
jgi:putative oxidoreductase